MAFFVFKFYTSYYMFEFSDICIYSPISGSFSVCVLVFPHFLYCTVELCRCYLSPEKIRTHRQLQKFSSSGDLADIPMQFYWRQGRGPGGWLDGWLAPTTRVCIHMYIIFKFFSWLNLFLLCCMQVAGPHWTDSFNLKYVFTEKAIENALTNQFRLYSIIFYDNYAMSSV